MSFETESHLFPADYLKNFCTAVFMHFGIAKADGEQAADVLAKSDLRGIDSHGVARLHTYFEMLELGRINPKPNDQDCPRESQRGDCGWRQWTRVGRGTQGK